jgi:hypothetical protein
MSQTRSHRRSPGRGHRLNPQRTAKFFGLAVLAVVAVGLVVVANAKVASTQQSTQVYTPALPSITAEPIRESLIEKLRSTDPVTVVVIGDSTGAQDFQWVNTLGRDLGKEFARPVDVATWSNETNSYGPTTRLSDGAGAALVIWNGSAGGKTPAYSQLNLAALIPEAATVDQVIVSHGHNTGPNPVLDISRLTTDIERKIPRVPMLLTVQNPPQGGSADDYRERANSIREWARSKPNWLVSDVYASFTSQSDMALLYLDNRHPNTIGSQLWADTTAAALGVL